MLVVLVPRLGHAQLHADPLVGDPDRQIVELLLQPRGHHPVGAGALLVLEDDVAIVVGDQQREEVRIVAADLPAHGTAGRGFGCRRHVLALDQIVGHFGSPHEGRCQSACVSVGADAPVEATSSCSGTAVPRAASNFVPIGLPQPVQASQPGLTR